MLCLLTWFWFFHMTGVNWLSTDSTVQKCRHGHTVNLRWGEEVFFSNFTQNDIRECKVPKIFPWSPEKICRLWMSHTTLADNKHRAYGLKYCMFMKTQSSVFDTMQSFWGHEYNFRKDLHPCYLGVWITKKWKFRKRFLCGLVYSLINYSISFLYLPLKQLEWAMVGPAQYCLFSALTKFVNLGPETTSFEDYFSKENTWLIFNKMFCWCFILNFISRFPLPSTTPEVCTLCEEEVSFVSSTSPLFI